MARAFNENEGAHQIASISGPRGTQHGGYAGPVASGHFSMSSASDRRLQRGDIFRTPGGVVAVIVYVNESRAYCKPLSGKQRQFAPGSGETASFESLGESFNISPNSAVAQCHRESLNPVQLDRLERIMAATEIAETTQSTRGAAIPGMTRAQKLARKPKSEARPLGTKANGKGKAERKAAAPKTVQKCKCGCGEETGGFFVPGHDARFKGKLLRIERGEDTPEKILGARVASEYKWVSVTRKVDGEEVKGKIPSMNYKGEPHEGYLKADGTKRAKQ